MFTKDGDQANNLHDMQCMWYELECGQAHLQRQHYGKVSCTKDVLSSIGCVTVVKAYQRSWVDVAEARLWTDIAAIAAIWLGQLVMQALLYGMDDDLWT